MASQRSSARVTHKHIHAFRLHEILSVVDGLILPADAGSRQFDQTHCEREATMTGTRRLNDDEN